MGPGTYLYSDDEGWCYKGQGFEEEVRKSHSSFVHLAIFYVENFVD
jgi:hypothetical protein